MRNHCIPAKNAKVKTPTTTPRVFDLNFPEPTKAVSRPSSANAKIGCPSFIKSIFSFSPANKLSRQGNECHHSCYDHPDVIDIYRNPVNDGISSHPPNKYAKTQDDVDCKETAKKYFHFLPFFLGLVMQDWIQHFGCEMLPCSGKPKALRPHLLPRTQQGWMPSRIATRRSCPTKETRRLRFYRVAARRVRMQPQMHRAIRTALSTFPIPTVHNKFELKSRRFVLPFSFFGQ